MAERKKARPQPLKIGGAAPVAEATDSPDGGGKFSVDTTEREWVGGYGGVIIIPLRVWILNVSSLAHTVHYDVGISSPPPPHYWVCYLPLCWLASQPSFDYGL